MKKVSVYMITFNHEKYIAKAIEGVLMQQTNFSFELVIGEDCSTDSTRSIIREYAERYPEIIKPLFPEKNLGMVLNGINTLRACKGEYIAVCEGDDYWTDPLKLQKQVDILDNQPDTIMVYTNADSSKGLLIKNRKTGPVNMEELPVFAPTLTRMYRNIIDEKYFALRQFYGARGGDTFQQIYLSAFGNFYYLDEVTAYYTIHMGGAWNGISELEKEIHVASTRIACLGLNPAVDRNLIRIIGFKVGRHLTQSAFIKQCLPPLVKKITPALLWPLLTSINKGVVERITGK